MLVLDTNHLVELGYRSAASQRLSERLEASGEPAFATIVSAEEQLRGWMAELHRVGDPARQIPLYRKLRERIEFYAAWSVLDWDAEAVAQFARLRGERIRIGTQDLKIASIVLSHNATLLTRNVVDFQKVPGLRIENWLD